MQRCTYCGNEQPDEAIACPVDGQPLKLVIISQPPVITPATASQRAGARPLEPDWEGAANIPCFRRRRAIWFALDPPVSGRRGLRYGDIGFSLFQHLLLRFSRRFAAALRCGLDYSWGRTAKSLLIIIFLPVVLIILVTSSSRPWYWPLGTDYPLCVFPF